MGSRLVLHQLKYSPGDQRVEVPLDLHGDGLWGCTNSIARSGASISIDERPGFGVMPTRRRRLGDAGRRCGFEAGALARPPGVIAFAGAPSRKPVGFDGASSSDSGSPSVLVDEAAEDVTTFDVAEWVAGEGRSWCLESDAPMGASCVVVVHVSAERVLQVAMGEDQQVIEAMDTPSVRQMRSHVERAPACERSRSPRTEGPRRRQR